MERRRTTFLDLAPANCHRIASRSFLQELVGVVKRGGRLLILKERHKQAIDAGVVWRGSAGMADASERGRLARA